MRFSIAFAAARSVLDRQCGIVLDTRDSAYSENIAAAGPLTAAHMARQD